MIEQIEKEKSFLLLQYTPMGIVKALVNKDINRRGKYRKQAMEEIIATDVQASFEYASHLKKRFELGESIIFDNVYFSNLYRDILYRLIRNQSISFENYHFQFRSQWLPGYRFDFFSRLELVYVWILDNINGRFFVDPTGCIFAFEEKMEAKLFNDKFFTTKRESQ